MVDIEHILKQWGNGEKTLEETNEALKGTGLYVDPDKQKIAEGEGAVYCDDLTQINGMVMVNDALPRQGRSQGRQVGSAMLKAVSRMCWLWLSWRHYSLHP